MQLTTETTFPSSAQLSHFSHSFGWLIAHRFIVPSPISLGRFDMGRRKATGKAKRPREGRAQPVDNALITATGWLNTAFAR